MVPGGRLCAGERIHGVTQELSKRWGYRGGIRMRRINYSRRNTVCSCKTSECLIRMSDDTAKPLQIRLSVVCIIYDTRYISLKRVKKIYKSQ